MCVHVCITAKIVEVIRQFNKSVLSISMRALEIKARLLYLCGKHFLHDF